MKNKLASGPFLVKSAGIAVTLMLIYLVSLNAAMASAPDLSQYRAGELPSICLFGAESGAGVVL